MCLSPLASGTCRGRGAMGLLGKQGDSLELELLKGCLFLDRLPHTRTPPKTTVLGFPALFTKNVYCIRISRGWNSPFPLSLSPRSSVFQKGTNLTWRIGFLVKEQIHPPSEQLHFQGSLLSSGWTSKKGIKSEFNGISDQQIPHSLLRLKINLEQSGESLMNPPPFPCP